jgi:signal transduction histidine kinase
VKRRIFITIVAVATLVVFAFGVPAAIAVENSYRDEAVLRLQRTAAAAAADADATMTFAPVSEAYAMADEPGIGVALYSLDGRRRVGTGPETADDVVTGAFAGRPADGMVDDDLVVAFPVTRDGELVGAARAALPEAIIDRRALGSGAAMAALGAVVLSIAALAAVWQTRRLTRPLDELTRAAVRLGDGDFTVRNVPSGFPEVDATAAALDRTAERLGRLIERERAFSTDVSHQLRTPLTGLRLALENALATPGVDTIRAVEVAVGAIDRLEATIEDLIALARDTTIAHEPADLARAFDELVEQWRGPLAEQGRELVVSPVDGLGPLRFSEAALRQTLEVLVANSAEHGAGTVTVDVSADGGNVSIDVSDEGPGISGDPALAFARRADRRANRGIGLALARTLVEAEGGRLVYRPAPRPCFSLTVPRDAN